MQVRHVIMHQCLVNKLDLMIRKYQIAQVLELSDYKQENLALLVLFHYLN